MAEQTRYLYVGRLEENTGLLDFLKWFDAQKEKYAVEFCGDGPLRSECRKWGSVHGLCDPRPYYRKAKYCVPGGYLAALEALSFGCKLKLFWSSTLKKDYWQEFPKFKKISTWDDVADAYLDLYHRLK